MEKISKEQRNFIIIYAWGHCFLGVVIVGMVVIFDLNKTVDSSSFLAYFLKYFTFYLYAPFVGLNRLGIQLPSIKFLDYLWLYLAGLMYGYSYLFIYKWITRR